MSSCAGLCAAESPCLVLSGEMGGGAQPDYNSSRLGVREREELCHYTAKRRGVGSEKRSKLLCTLLEVRHSNVSKLDIVPAFVLPFLPGFVWRGGRRCAQSDY